MLTYFGLEFETNVRRFDLLLQVLIMHWWRVKLRLISAEEQEEYLIWSVRGHFYWTKLALGAEKMGNSGLDSQKLK